MLSEIKQDMISLLMPTRGRRQLAEYFITTAFYKASNPEQIEVIVYADEDDTDSHSLNSLNDNVTLLTGPRSTMGEMITSCFRQARGDIFALISDDVKILTAGWDTALREAHATYPDRIYLAYPDDLYKKKCTFPVISRQCAEILQDPYPAEYLAAFIDTHLFDIFQRVKRQGFDRIHFLRDVQFEHRHYRAGKSVRDSTYLNTPRFTGDLTFLTQIEKRVGQAAALVAELGNDPIPLQGPTNQSCPTALVSRILFIFRNIALDRGLPVLWRSYFAAFLIARSIVSKFYKNQSRESIVF